MFVFKHPKYYKGIKFELNKSDQAISSQKTVDVGDSVRPGPGPKQQASSVKPQAPEASSDKHQAPSSKRQAGSHKQQAP